MECVLFDGDVLTYKAGFSVEKRHYVVIRNGPEMGCKRTRTPIACFKYKKHAIEFSYEEDEIEQATIAEGLSHAISNLNSIILKTLTNLELEEYKIILSDPVCNFRKDIAVTLPYKGNRKENTRPVHYEELREYLISHHSAVVTKNEEADDMLGYMLYNNQDKYIVASIDKDLLMVPGTHYNIDKDAIINSKDPGELELYKDKGRKSRLAGYGFKWFCAQMLLGDTVDNIPGVKGVGAVKSLKILGDLKTKKQCWEAVQDTYIKKGLSKERLMETANLLWIRRVPNDKFNERWLDE